MRMKVRLLAAGFALLIGLPVVPGIARACPGDADCDGILDADDKCTLDPFA